MDTPASFKLMSWNGLAFTEAFIPILTMPQTTIYVILDIFA